MGFVNTNLLPLLKESRRRPFSGHALCLGHPSLHMSAERVNAIVDLALARTINTQHDPELSGVSLLLELGFDSVTSLDISRYEGAEIEMDLNCACVPPSLREAFNVVIDHGTLEHVYHVPNAMATIYELLATGGRVFHSAPGSNFFDHGFYSFSPTFFHDYYEANRWEVNRLQVYQMRDSSDTSPPFFADYTPGAFDALSYGGLGDFMYGTICVATKTTESTYGVAPHQSRYRNRPGWR